MPPSRLEHEQISSERVRLYSGPICERMQKSVAASHSGSIMNMNDWDVIMDMRETRW